MATPKKLYNNKPGTASATLATATSGKTTIVKEIIVTNTSGTEATVTISFDGTEVIVGKKIPPNDTVIYRLSSVLEAGDLITGSQGTAGAIAVTISGVEL
ncbi:hypothetical protein P7D05_13565 [Bacillus paranthracis]|uniref:hypothetical protein n=1 Tax=Bacillus paranthracis TaxID=2026186 RepID=UPI00240E667E|nr:hypothetical protein [Bacillus paranthracis]MDG1603847.1 hypothetical protein [Bacillus paranthracis]